MNGPNAIVVVRDPEGTLRDLDWAPDAEVEVEAVALSSRDGLDVLRHSTAHVLAQAVQQEWPEARLGIGPPIENGFYYDFDVERPFQPEDLERVEQRMKDIIKSGQRFRRREFPSLDAARDELAREPYKLELVDLKGDVDTSEVMEVGSGDLTIYDNVDAKTGDVCWSDLCRGPHLPSTRLIPAFKLMRSAAAYWRGSEKNPQLQRIYGTAWPTRDALKSHLKALEEAAKRDHRRIGEDLDMFAFSKEIGRGLPLWLPNGTIVRDELEGWARRTERKLGYQRVVTPHITQEDLYYLSGHLPYYAEDLYAPIEIDGEKYYLKPMNCPHHHMVYKARPHSYRDLPYKIAEYGTVYRFERSGQLHGTMRTRGFTQNDAHIYCTQEQAKDQFLEVMRMHADYYRTLGITDFYMVLALRDPANREKYHDDEVMWETAERITREAMEESDIPFEIDRGGAAHYGPKVDFMIRAVTGKEFAASTNQVDLYTPQRFGLTYHDSDGTEKPVVVIHRAPLGSQERFTAYLTEHFAGAFPVWMAPEQVRVIPIVDELTDYANEVRDLLLDADVRADVDAGDGRLNAKVRTAVTRKIPLIVVVGRREAEERAVTVRDRSGKETPMPLDAFVGHVTELIRTKSLDGAGHLRRETDGGNA
ncbi:threonine--tRNA ligase [Streptomyces griseocarneus]|uniref:threonine--tRNA ligase n=1 Tax=Streptomyces griseocarneus TaxID=51201 RepID=UPI0021E160D8